jgi:hypothetical protein
MSLFLLLNRDNQWSGFRWSPCATRTIGSMVFSEIDRRGIG